MTATVEITTTTNRATVAGWDLADALRACLLSASKDDKLPILCAIQIAKAGDQLTLSSTDRYRLTEATLTLDVNGVSPDNWEVIVQRDDAQRLVTALGKRTARGVALPVTVAFEHGEMYGPLLTVRTFDGELRLSGVEGDYPKVRSLWPSESTPTEQIGFNPQFMADLCKMPGRERNTPVVVKFNGPTRPMVTSWEDPRGNVRYRHLLMPVRLAS